MLSASLVRRCWPAALALAATVLGCDVEIPATPDPDASEESASEEATSGRLDPTEIQRTIRSRFGPMRACYEAELAKKPGLGGSVKLGFVIDREGAVRDVEDRGSDLPDANVVACVARVFEELSFPEPTGGEVHVTYPIVFGPK